MSEPVILTEIDARGVATLRLNRPEVNNAYNGELVDAIVERMETLASDDAVRVIIIRGNGRHFQAGADLTWIRETRAAGKEVNKAASHASRKAFFGLNGCPKPTIALVHGGCFGGGTGIAAACDIVIAEERAIFGITEARWGLVPTMILPQLLALRPLRLLGLALLLERDDKLLILSEFHLEVPKLIQCLHGGKGQLACAHGLLLRRLDGRRRLRLLGLGYSLVMGCVRGSCRKAERRSGAGSDQ